jgi:LmbE family N-acetylglucosaminyl deacetylase
MNALGTAALLTAIAASIPVARELSRTSRLRAGIRGNLDLLAALPDDHPQRDDLAECIESQVRELVARERRRRAPNGWQAAFWISWASLLFWLWWFTFRYQVGWETGAKLGWGKIVGIGAVVLGCLVLATRALYRRPLD